MANAADLYIKSGAALDRLHRAQKKCEWLSYHKGPDPFLIHADKLAALEATAKAATAEWTEAAKNLSVSQIVAIIAASQVEAA